MNWRFLIVVLALALGALAAYLFPADRPAAAPSARSREGTTAPTVGPSGSSASSPRPRRTTAGAGRVAGAVDPEVIDLTSLPSDDRRNEPRRDAWAVPMEQRLAVVFASRVAEDWPDVKLVGVTCRSTSCKIEYDLPEEHAKEIWIFLQLTMPHSARTAPALSDDVSDGMVRATFEAKYDDVPDVGAFETWFQSSLPAADQNREHFRAARNRGERWGE